MEPDLIQDIKQGKIFIYPTDTIYGIGCDALNKESVAKIREIKKRDKHKPFSIIAPSKQWIKDNCIVDYSLDKYLPGPYTLILKKKDSEFLQYVAHGPTLGVRIPDNEFAKKVKTANTPFITTSVNISHEPHATKISEIPNEIIKKVDRVIDIGELSGRPSTLVIDGKEVER